jgi:DNA-binding CsgD family transcriptional regulator
MHYLRGETETRGAVLERLRTSDMRAALTLVYDAGTDTGPDALPRPFLAGLADLIPADVIVGYSEIDVKRPWRIVDRVEIPVDGVPEVVQREAKPFCPQDPLQNAVRRREQRVLKLSDCLTQTSRRKLEFDHYVWKPLAIHDSLRVWLPAPHGRARAVYLERSSHDFTERERSLLQLLRPSLIRMLQRTDDRRREDAWRRLTPREREILSAIAAGQTTPEIAERFVVSPHTVRKHVEHILEKLGARTRSEAVARTGSALARER